MAAFKYRAQYRPYYPARRGQQARGGGDFERGWQIGGQIGKGLSGLAKAIAGQQTLARQNAVANQLMNTRNAPRAGLVAPGVNPRTGAANVIPARVPTAGTTPFSGGAEELENRVKMQRLVNELYPPQTQGRTTPVGPGLGSRSAWAQHARGGGWGRGGRGGGGGGRGGGGGGAAGGGGGGGGRGKTPVDTNAPQNPAQYNFTTMRDQFDAQHGKGSYDQMSPFLDNIQPAGDPLSGTGLQFNAKGGLDYYKDGKLQTSMMGNDVDYWLKRINTARSNAGLEPIHTPLQGSGTMDDPYLLKNPWDYGSVPYNQYFTTTDTPQVGQKLRPEDAVKQGFAADIALGGRRGGGEDYLSSWATVGGGKTTGPDLPAPLPLAPETGGSGYSASAGIYGAGAQPAPDEEAYRARFNPPPQPVLPDDQAYQARFNPSFQPPAMQPLINESVGVSPSQSTPAVTITPPGGTSYLDPNLIFGGT
jgi:hypothetical protein